MRKPITLTVAIILMTVYAVVIAGETGNTEVYKFKFDGIDGMVAMELNSETMGFGLHDLRPGDSRITVTEDGTSITISRLAEVYSLDIGGEVFEIPARHGPSHMAAGHMGGHMKGHTDGARRMAIAHGMADGLTILSKDPLDETKQATIRDALSAAGIVDEVEFLSPGLSMLGDGIIEETIEDDGAGRRRMIIKRVIAD